MRGPDAIGTCGEVRQKKEHCGRGEALLSPNAQRSTSKPKFQTSAEMTIKASEAKVSRYWGIGKLTNQ